MAIHTTKQIAGAAGLSFRQVDGLVRRGVLRPGVQQATGKGSRRLFDDRDLRLAKMIGRTTRLGMTYEMACQAALMLYEAPDDMAVIFGDGLQPRTVSRGSLAARLRDLPTAVVVLPLT